MSAKWIGAWPIAIAVALFAAAVGVFAWHSGPPPFALRAGAPAPAFALERLAGGRVALDSLRGKVVFVNFWATWCAPCRTEAPSLERLYRSVGSDHFEIVAISIDSADVAPIVQFQREFSLSFPILLDPLQRAYGAYQAYGVPETFLVAPDGTLLERFVGPRNWDDPRYVRAIRRALEAAGESGGDANE